LIRILVIATARGSKARAGCPLVKELAKAANVGSRTVENDEDDNGAPFRTVEEYLAWRSKNRATRKPATEGGEDLRERKLLAEAIKIEAEGRIKELDAKVREGELINRTAVDRFLAAWVSAERAEMETWADSFATEMPGEMRQVIHDLVAHKVRQKLVRLAEMPADLWAEEGLSE
jgi:hypothetical protein